MRPVNGHAGPVAPVPIRWRLARGFIARLRGLLGREPPAPGTALLIVPCKAVHTIGMQYPIDIVFLTRDGGVLRVCPRVMPSRARVCWQAWGVAELTVGEASRLGIVAGAMLALPPNIGPTAKSRRDR